MECDIETSIDGTPFVWRVDGDFASGRGPALCRIDRDRLLPGLGSEGYRIIDLPAGWAEQMGERAAAQLGCEHRELLPSYHLNIDEARHLQRIEKTRELRLRDFTIRPPCLAELLGERLGVRLTAEVAALGRDHVQLRINRPASTDYNPPHRDGSLPIWANTVNVWIPIAGVDELTSLPIVPGSHRVAEAECWQTRPGGAVIRGRRYHVPAIARLRQRPLEMVRTPVAFGQALVFTPYLIHGLAVNQSAHTRMALELRLEIAEP
jgi:hypothetical protein